MFLTKIFTAAAMKSAYGTGYAAGYVTETIKDECSKYAVAKKVAPVVEETKRGYREGCDAADVAFEKREEKRRERNLAKFNVSTPVSFFNVKESNSRKAAEELLDEFKKSFVKDEFKEPSVNPAPVEAEPTTEEPVNEAPVAEEPATETPVNPAPQPKAEQKPVNPAPSPSVPDPGYNDTDILFETGCCDNAAAPVYTGIEAIIVAEYGAEALERKRVQEAIADMRDTASYHYWQVIDPMLDELCCDITVRQHKTTGKWELRRRMYHYDEREEGTLFESDRWGEFEAVNI